MERITQHLFRFKIQTTAAVMHRKLIDGEKNKQKQKNNNNAKLREGREKGTPAEC